MGILKTTLTSYAGNLALRALLPVLETTRGRSRRLLRILTYHRVDEENQRPHLNARLISASPDEFRQQIACIANHMTPVSMEQVLDAMENNRSLPNKAVLVTFDDAYRCFYETAWPILKRFEVPSTLFVATAYPESARRFWWDRLAASLHSTSATEWVNERGVTQSIRSGGEKTEQLKHWMNYVKSLDHTKAMQWVDRVCNELGEQDFESPVMTWNELREVASDNVTIAAHTQTHPLLNRVDDFTIRAELVNSYRELNDQIGSVPRVAAYPGGAHDNRVTEIAKEEGFSAAFTVQRGVANVASGNRFRIPRINVGRGTTTTLLRAQCNTHPSIFRA